MKRPLIVALSLCMAAPAFAQDSSTDWDIHRDPAKGSVIAYTSFDNGLSIGFRCSSEAMNVVVGGLPASRAERRTFQLGFRGAAERPSLWTTTTDPSVVVGDLPAPLARDFRQGGALRLTVPGGAADGRNLRYEVELPTSSAAIDEVLTTCGKPLVDPRDSEFTDVDAAGLPAGLEWRQEPRARFPRTNYASGFAVISCITNANGTLRDCVVEMEHPFDSGFGRAALRATERASVRLTGQPDVPFEPRKMAFLTRFRGG